MKIVLAFALLIVIAKANPSEDARVEEQEEMLVPEVDRSIEESFYRSIEESFYPFKEAFEIFDKDGDGIVSIADMVELIKSSGLSYEGDNIRQKIKQADTNGDVAIDFDEFITIFKSATGLFSRGAKKYFKKFDKDDDGFISKAEFKKKAKSIMKNLGKDITNDEIKDAFKIIDSNEDGKISLDEFKAMPEIPLLRCICCIVIGVVVLVLAT